jgi:methylenetetrahydrofolate reductase (NADPH)
MSLQLSELHRATQLVVSFELFPPKTPEAESRLFDRSIPEMLRLRPAFLTCTYGAGGSTQEKTLDIVSRAREQFGIETASHLTCVGSSREQIARFLDQARAAGISNLVALRGDPPKGDLSFRPHPDGFKLAAELVGYIKSVGGFDVAVAAYPEGHPECPDKYLDWQRCRQKVDAGADVIITQLFYDNRDFLTFRDYLRGELGVKVPIVAGVLPILSSAQIKRFCGMCGAKLPPHVLDKLESYADDDLAARQYGIELATRMCEELIREGVAGIHFYTLNRPDSTAAVMRNLGLVP